MISNNYETLSRGIPWLSHLLFQCCWYSHTFIAGHVAALLTFRMNSLLPFESTIEQTTEIVLALKQ